MLETGVDSGRGLRKDGPNSVLVVEFRYLGLCAVEVAKRRLDAVVATQPDVVLPAPWVHAGGGIFSPRQQRVDASNDRRPLLVPDQRRVRKFVLNSGELAAKRYDLDLNVVEPDSGLAPEA